MQKLEIPLTFTCPVCKGNFQFDRVDEYQLVPCPICGIGFITVRAGQTLLLKDFEFETVSAIWRNDVKN